MEQLEMNFVKIKEAMNSDEGKLKLAHLNEQNLRVQQLDWTLNVEKMKYTYDSLLYKEFLGYDLSTEEKNQLKELAESISKIEGVHYETV